MWHLPWPSASGTRNLLPLLTAVVRFRESEFPIDRSAFCFFSINFKCATMLCNNVLQQRLRALLRLMSCRRIQYDAAYSAHSPYPIWTTMCKAAWPLRLCLCPSQSSNAEEGPNLMITSSLTSIRGRCPEPCVLLYVSYCRCVYFFLLFLCSLFSFCLSATYKWFQEALLLNIAQSYVESTRTIEWLHENLYF